LTALADEAREMEYPLMAQDVAMLGVELLELTPGHVIVGGPTLLGQMFNDPSLIPDDATVTYVGAREFRTIVPVPPAQSLATRVARWYAEEHLGFRDILRDSVDPISPGGFRGIGEMHEWAGVFVSARRRLEEVGATAQDVDAFREGVDRAIDEATPDELTEEARLTLRALLATTFDGEMRPLQSWQPARAHFLKRIRFL
jgi:hypothetical protein